MLPCPPNHGEATMKTIYLGRFEITCDAEDEAAVRAAYHSDEADSADSVSELRALLIDAGATSVVDTDEE